VFQVRQCRITDTEVVNRQSHASLFQNAHLRDGHVHVVGQQAFSQLQLEPVGADAGIFDGRHHQLYELGVAKLAHADIDGNRELFRLWTFRPCGKLGASGFQHPLAQRQDQPAFLGLRDEVVGKHQPTLRVLPAQQGFDTHHIPLAAHLRLVVQHKILVAQTVSQLAGQSRVGRRDSLHTGVKKADRVASRGFGLVHRQIGLLEQLADVLLVLVDEGDAYAAGAVVVDAGQVAGLAQGGQNFLRHEFCLGAGDLRVVAQVFQQNHKLITTQAGHGVAQPYAGVQAAGYFL